MEIHVDLEHPFQSSWLHRLAEMAVSITEGVKATQPTMPTKLSSLSNGLIM